VAGQDGAGGDRAGTAFFVYSRFKNKHPERARRRSTLRARLLNTFDERTSRATVKCEILSPEGKLVAKDDETESIKGAFSRGR